MLLMKKKTLRMLQTKPLLREMLCVRNSLILERLVPLCQQERMQDR